jgi:protein O-GlcNAc transferase
MATISEALRRALAHHQAGHWELAEDIYRRVLAVDPGQADALYLLGVLANQRERPAEAEGYLRRAVAAAPQVAEFHNSLGVALKAQQRLDEAAACYRQALALKPDWADATSNLGNVLHAQGRFAEAEAVFVRAVAAKPDLPEAHNGLALARQSLGRLDEAIAGYEQALRLRPQDADAECNLASALKAAGRLDEAIAAYQRGIRLRPERPEPLNNLGSALQERGAAAEAVACYQQALACKPDYVEARYNLANALKALGRLSAAVAEYQRVLALRPDFAEAHNNLGNALKAQGDLDGALAAFGRALELKPDHVGAHSNQILTLQYRPSTTLAELADACADFERRHALALRPAAGVEPPRPRSERPLRLGFVSPDFARHPVGYFLIRTLENLDRAQTYCVCYSDRRQGDELTARFRAAAERWHASAGWSDEQLAAQIRADRIDILFDLAGHTAHHRLLVFARRPAPLQITWIGYPGTTGLSAIDYLLADQYTVPTAAEPFYREQVLRMPDGYVCYEPPRDAPPVGPLPALTAGRVTFASFNNPAKIGPEWLGLWARILRRLPDARLLLKYAGVDDPGVGGRWRALFGAQGVAPERIELEGGASQEELLRCYQRVDVALDTWPYNGGLTTCEALWMGVPVVTLPGATFASRHSLGHLSTLGLTETIARDADHYVEIAVRLATDLPRLAALRAQLRERMAGSPLCDGRRFAEKLSAVLRDAWRRG